MPARWNLQCASCGSLDFDIPCSMFAIPPCSCGAERTLAPVGIMPKSQVFPFDSQHVTPDGSPLVIESMRHLRQVENDYGVVFSAFNNNVNNSVDPMQGALPRYRGEDEDFRRNHRR